MQTLSIASTLTPSQMLSQKGVANPRERGPLDWAFQPVRDPIFNETGLPVDQQSDNYRALNEGYQQVKNGMFNRLVGTEPVYGNFRFPRNPLDQEQTNRAVRSLQMQTQQESNGAPHTINPYRTVINNPSQYPYNLGRPIYENDLIQLR